jgi:small conductance mechanosensitive channel
MPMRLDVVVLTGVPVLDLWITRLVIVAVIAFVTWRGARWARESFDRAASKTAADANTRLLAARILYGAVLTIGLIWLLGFLGVEQASILATFGAIGLALSLAVQDILKSFFAGLYLLFERPFIIGDEVQVKEHIGRVEHVGFRATSIRTVDNVLVLVPNSIVFAEVVRNLTHRTPSDVTEAPSASPRPEEGPART